MESKPRYNILVIFILSPLLLALAILYAGSLKKSNAAAAVCSTEAKICSDGTAVGRTGPLCEFAACPVDNYVGWKTFSDSKTGLTFKYPTDLGKKFVFTANWPPKVTFTTGPIVCPSAGSNSDPNGKTALQRVEEHNYCINRKLSDIPGGIYGLYTFTTQKDDKNVVFTFSLRAARCPNFIEPAKTACASEQQDFDIGPTIDRIYDSLEVNNPYTKLIDSGN